jgi:DNA polymerase-3 subunit delta'
VNAAAAAFLESAQRRRMGAYLLICPRPDVAARLADAFLMRLYCAKGGCGVCADCRKVLSGHVDVLRLSAPRVDDFREAIAFVAQEPYEGACRAVVIGRADDMTDAAGNSMLKTLEEPPANAVLLLMARSVSGVLPTIASRCAAVRIAPEPDAEARIARELAVDGDTAHILADLSGGFVDEAKRVYADKALLKLRGDALDMCARLCGQKNDAVKDHADFLEANKENIVLLLTVMQSFFRDILMLQKTRSEAWIVNRDRASDIVRAASGFTTGAAYNMMNVLLETERRFSFPLNFRLAAENMLFKLLEEKNRWKK